MPKEITFHFSGENTTFQVSISDNTNKGLYYFLECKDKPQNRGWFSDNFIKNNPPKI